MAYNKDSTVVVFDVGRNTSECVTKNGQSFLELEKECAKKIFMRKLFSKPKDDVALVLTGTDGTDNRLHGELGGYEHISNAFPLGSTTWNMLKYIEYSIDPTNNVADWIDAIVVAMDVLKQQAAPKTNLKIVLLTTFTTTVNADQVDSVTSALKSEKIELIVISTAIEYQLDDGQASERAVFSQATQKDSVRKQNEKLIQKLIDETNGVLCSFDGALQQMIYFERVQKRRTPWNCNLEIGTNIKIAVASYIYIREENQFQSWKPRGPNAQKCKSITEHFHNENKIEESELVDKILKGYMYGQQPIPYGEGISYESGGRSLKCVGFAKSSDVHDEHLCGGGIWTVVAQKGTTVADKMLAALIKVMRESKLVMIARYVYGGNTKPKMMVLYPNNLLNDKPNHNSLLMQELVFRDNLVEMQLPSLKIKKTEPTAEQYDAVDKLIDSMDLMSVDLNDDHGEAFKHLLNPILQHTYRRIAHRALHPKEPLSAPDQDLLAMLNVPKSVAVQAKPHIDQVKELFKLEHIKRDAKQRLYKKMQDISSPPATADTAGGADNANEIILVEIGTVTPDEDFGELLRRGERFATLATQIQSVIEKLVFISVAISEEKVLRAIVMYREEAKLLAPYSFNEWIVRFKASLLQRRKLDAWEKLIVAERLGLITSRESTFSTVTDGEAEEFYRSDTGNGDQNAVAIDDDENDDDLFANM